MSLKKRAQGSLHKVALTARRLSHQATQAGVPVQGSKLREEERAEKGRDGSTICFFYIMPPSWRRTVLKKLGDQGTV